MGKYYTQGDKVLMPLAIQVHHAVCDGFHVGRMLNELQQFLCMHKRRYFIIGKLALREISGYGRKDIIFFKTMN